MDYNTLLDMATDVGYELAMSGAETFRVEESINRILGAYGISSEVFAIPNCVTVSIETEDGQIMTRMRRIGSHGNDLDSVERFNGLSRAICNRVPDPSVGKQWLEHVRKSRVSYGLPMYLVGNFIGAAGFAGFFGGDWLDCICGGICGLVVGISTRLLESMKTNPFFRIISAAFIMALIAYMMRAVGLCHNADAAIIGALMILVPGLLFTNAMRDIIYGDTTSGVNRIVQVLLTAVALALGTAAAWSFASTLFGAPQAPGAVGNSILAQCVCCAFGCLGFMILFNIHGPGGILCVLGGLLTWLVYIAAFEPSGSDLVAYFWSSLFASLYSEVMGRIRKQPAIAYLVVSIFPLIPGAGIYYTMNYAVQGFTQQFVTQGMHTAAIAGIIAVGILLGTSGVKMYYTLYGRRKQ